MYRKVVIAFIFLTFIVRSQSVEFHNYTVRNGLSNNKVNCVIQDRQGFLWFGCEDGLNRFDGYDFKVFRPSEKKNSISSKDIWSLYEDRDGNIWIGTKSGDINKLDYRTKKFSYWNIQQINLNDNSITAMYVDKNKNVWVGTYQQGLFKFDSSGNQLSHWDYNPENKNGISNNFITSIIEDRFGKLWISTYYGLNEFDPQSPVNGFIKYFSDEGSLNSNLIWEIRLSSDSNKIWICTASGLRSIDIRSKKIEEIFIEPVPSIQFSQSVGDIVENFENGRHILYVGTYGGLVRIDLQSGNQQRFIQNLNDEKSLVSNQINQMIKDKSGVIWFATEKGISSLSPRYNFFSHLVNNSSLNQKVFNLEVKALIKYDAENILVGTSEGLYKLNLKNFRETEIPQFKNLNIWSILKDGDNIWVGTYGQGLFKYNVNSQKAERIKIEYPLFQTQSYNFIKSLLADKKGNIYAATWGGGLVILNKKTGKIQFHRRNKNNAGTISYNDVWSILQDKSGRIWIATNGGGLNLFDDEKNIFHSLTTSNSNGHLKSNSIISIYESNESSDDKTVLWICQDNGLTKLSLKNRIQTNDLAKLIISSKTFNSSNGLSSEIIKSLIEDEKGDLWVSTGNGIFMYDKSSDKFVQIPYYLERKPTDYSSGAALNFENKIFLFGSNEGLKVFAPKDILFSDFKSEVIISDFQIFNKSVFDDPEIFSQIFSEGKITVPYNQNEFSFTFSSTDYNNPSSNKYAYMMKGFERDWNFSDTRRFVTYTNLSPGQYEFLVKCTNSDGKWNDKITSVLVEITPPWWRTPWAYAGIMILFLSGILLIRRLELKKAKLVNELRMKEFETEKLREVEAMKSRFFANISHELRTPLMLIKGPLDELMNQTKPGITKELVQLASKNSAKLKELIDQLLELTQLDSSKIPVKASYNDLVEFTKNIYSSFKTLTEKKNINFIFDSTEEQIFAWFDKDILEKVLNNLISNAYKFTASNGKIGIRINKNGDNDKQFASITVWDNGIGIEEKELEKIFDRFYQATDSAKKNYSGFGIGLSLIKEFVDLHRWRIDVKSKKGEGTEFTLSIPLYEYLDDSQKIEIQETEEKIQNESSPNELISVNTNETKKEKPTIMIVEDSEDVRFYISSLLKDEYDIFLAENGKDALEKCVEQLPDLIISDIMMPEMDGLEFCKMIKSDWKTSHIPVVLLTARMTVDDKIEGLELGADDYITKPFNSRELKIRIKNLLEQRRRLKELYSTSAEIKPEPHRFTEEENEFLQNAIKIVEENVDKPDFDLETFAEKMCLSRSQLHRKLIQLTNESPGEFIRTIKLKYAAKLLMQKNFSITQIAFEVGFTSPSHFTKAFKQFFDCTPKEYIQKMS